MRKKNDTKIKPKKIN